MLHSITKHAKISDDFGLGEQDYFPEMQSCQLSSTERLLFYEMSRTASVKKPVVVLIFAVASTYMNASRARKGLTGIADVFVHKYNFIRISNSIHAAADAIFTAVQRA